MAFRMQLALGWIAAAFLLLPASSSELFINVPLFAVSPSVLNIDYCVTFWAKNITCYWDLLPETHPPTTYVLHVTEESGRCRRDFGGPMQCVVGPGERSCSIPIENLFAFYKIRLVGKNQDGQLSSSETCIHGMSVVKLSPPVIDAITANHSHCFQVSWHLPGDEILSASEAQYEIQYQDMAESSWMQVNFTVAEDAIAFANVCGLFPFTNYSVQVRAKYLCMSSLLNQWGPYWSDWSTVRFVQTRPAVPSNGPALWRKLGTPEADGKRAVVLMWKPLEPKQANGEIQAYCLYSQRDGEPAVLQCHTRDLQCSLSLPARIEHTFLLRASNTAGVSPPSKLVVPPSGGREDALSPIPVLASPAGGNGLLLQWSLPSFPEMAYVLEWGPLPEEKRNPKFFWCRQPGNVNRAVIKEAIEPGRLYSLRIFALLDGRIWASGSTTSYSKQIAPLRAPVLYPTQVWKTRMKLQWEKLPLKERGGVIRNYSIGYKEDGKEERTVVVVGSVQSCIIEDLRPGSVVRIYITASTEGGSTRGPALAVLMRSSDYGETETFLSVICVGFLLTLLLIAGSLICVWKHRKIQKYLWPQIPDPSKSGLATWMPPKLCLVSKDLPPHCPEKWNQGYLGLTVADVLKAAPPSQQGGSSFGRLLSTRWLVQVQKAGEEDLPKADYSKVVVQDVSPCPSCSLSKQPTDQSPQVCRPGALFGQGVWLQNLTYEAGMHRAALGSAGKFPLLANLMEKSLCPVEMPHKDISQSS
ncbi:granulocyte colony-stimulating factor receptor-like [Anolis sagrei]|uniref:granulocyte colony-stimulating factor receptor-like n=1 Tax=Anolis sagrei TaxID=38937 RepID=UPI0035209C63